MLINVTTGISLLQGTFAIGLLICLYHIKSALNFSRFLAIITDFTRVTVHDDCINKFNEFRLSRGKTKFIIYKITDDKKTVVVDQVSSDPDWEVFRTALADAKDSAGNPAPRFATYDVEYEIAGEGQRLVKLVIMSARDGA